MQRLSAPIRNILSVRLDGRTLGAVVWVALLLGLLGGAWGCAGGFEGAKPQLPLIITQPASVTVTATNSTSFVQSAPL